MIYKFVATVAAFGLSTVSAIDNGKGLTPVKNKSVIFLIKPNLATISRWDGEAGIFLAQMSTRI
jgi:hypothetical protein